MTKPKDLNITIIVELDKLNYKSYTINNKMQTLELDNLIIEKIHQMSEELTGDFK